MIVTFVPETYDLEGEDAVETMANVDRWQLLKDSFIRFRYADGFSYARAVAFQVVLTLIPAGIVIVAVAVLIGDAGFQSAVEGIFRSVTPGPATDALVSGFDAAEENARRNFIAIAAGGLTAAVSGATAMSQVQRGASRMYGVLDDRKTVHRYTVSIGLMFSVGLLLVLGFLAIGFGSSLGGGFSDEIASVWAWVRWPIGAALVGLAMALLYKVAPNRKQPSIAWLATGGYMATAVWLLLTIALTLYLNGSSTFGDTYGALAGFIGILLWAQLTGIAILFGVAFTAQLEAVRAGVAEPAIELDRPLDSSAIAGTTS
jgi:YihY family inner membrane protein